MTENMRIVPNITGRTGKATFAYQLMMYEHVQNGPSMTNRPGLGQRQSDAKRIRNAFETQSKRKECVPPHESPIPPDPKDHESAEAPNSMIRDVV